MNEIFQVSLLIISMLISSIAVGTDLGRKSSPAYFLYSLVFKNFRVFKTRVFGIKSLLKRIVFITRIIPIVNRQVAIVQKWFI